MSSLVLIRKLARSSGLVKPFSPRLRLEPYVVLPHVAIMNPTMPPSFETLISAFSEISNFRVWSLLVSLFGDIARKDGQELSSAAIGDIMAQIGIKPEATRVALHRLKKDDWIETRKSGRSSFYFLTAKGRKHSRDAALRIYDFGECNPDAWHIIVVETSKISGPWDDKTAGYVPLNNTTWLGAGHAPAFEHGLIIQGSAVTIPKWVIKAAFSDEFIAASINLNKVLDYVAKSLPNLALTPLQRAALRLVIVHEWRRLLFRSPALPQQAYPRSVRLGACRLVTRDCLGVLGHIDPDEINIPV